MIFLVFVTINKNNKTFEQQKKTKHNFKNLTFASLTIYNSQDTLCDAEQRASIVDKMPF